MRILSAMVMAAVTLCFVARKEAANAGDNLTYLVNVGKGETTTDTGSDGETKNEIVNEPVLGGKAMRVMFGRGDSIGGRARVKDWRKFQRIKFLVHNSGEAVELEFNIVHAGSTDYQTRVVVPVSVKPGKNIVAIDLAKLRNVNGAVPDLGDVVRWYLADAGGNGPTLEFGDIALERPSGAATESGSQTRAKVHGDPDRVKRIRAAKMPAVTEPVLFDTPIAGAVMSALEIFPEDNPWNLVISDWPLHPDSRDLIASIGADKPLRYNTDMNFVLVPPDQRRVEVKLTDYADESDAGPYPVPDNTPIEGWPRYYSDSGQRLSLDDVQLDKLNQGGDRHAVVLDPANRTAYEFYSMKKTSDGWTALQASIFDLSNNKLRPDGWTSTDAAGLPLIAAVVRYDELQRGAVEHAMRVTIERSRQDYVYPATHHAGHATDPKLPRMGERLRLRQDFPIAGFSPEVTAILKGLKKYGMLVADNGLAWSISVTPDPRIPLLHEELRRIKGSDFEVVVPPAGYEPPGN